MYRAAGQICRKERRGGKKGKPIRMRDAGQGKRKKHIKRVDVRGKRRQAGALMVRREGAYCTKKVKKKLFPVLEKSFLS
jgi:hypothetical protein